MDRLNTYVASVATQAGTDIEMQRLLDGVREEKRALAQAYNSMRNDAVLQQYTDYTDQVQAQAQAQERALAPPKPASQQQPSRSVVRTSAGSKQDMVNRMMQAQSERMTERGDTGTYIPLDPPRAPPQLRVDKYNNAVETQDSTAPWAGASDSMNHKINMFRNGMFDPGNRHMPAVQQTTQVDTAPPGPVGQFLGFDSPQGYGKPPTQSAWIPRDTNYFS